MGLVRDSAGRRLARRRAASAAPGGRAGRARRPLPRATRRDPRRPDPPLAPKTSRGSRARTRWPGSSRVRSAWRWRGDVWRDARPLLPEPASAGGEPPALALRDAALRDAARRDAAPRAVGRASNAAPERSRPGASPRERSGPGRSSWPLAGRALALGRSATQPAVVSGSGRAPEVGRAARGTAERPCRLSGSGRPRSRHPVSWPPRSQCCLEKATARPPEQQPGTSRQASRTELAVSDPRLPRTLRAVATPTQAPPWTFGWLFELSISPRRARL